MIKISSSANDTHAVYDELVEEIGVLYQSGRVPSSSEANERQLECYWRIGKRIVEVEQDGSMRAAYGAGLVASLARSLTERFKTGFSRRTLWDMRRFFAAYSRGEYRAGLMWSHLRALLALPDSKEREALALRAANERLSNVELHRLVRMARQNGGKDVGAGRVFARPGGAFFRYALEDKDALHVAGPGVLLDLGFHVRRLVSDMDHRGLAPGDIVEVRGRGRAAKLEKVSDDLQRYVYAATVGRVIDGDTIAAYVDLGFGVTLEQKLRLRALDAPEPGTAAGDKAARFVKSALRPGQTIAIRTHVSDRYDRYLADVFFSPRETGAHKIFAEGRYLNEELLAKGLAAYYRGG